MIGTVPRQASRKREVARGRGGRVDESNNRIGVQVGRPGGPGGGLWEDVVLAPATALSEPEEGMAKKQGGRRSPPPSPPPERPAVTPERFSRLYKLLQFLGGGP